MAEGNGNANGGNGKSITVTRSGLVIPTGLVLSAVLWLGHAVDTRLAAIEASVAQIERRLWTVEQRAGDRWTGTDQVVWASDLARRNPKVDVPPPVARLGLEGGH